jgi:hypothetical protein
MNSAVRISSNIIAKGKMALNIFERRKTTNLIQWKRNNEF